ncbi:MAG: hypothetical protein COS89_07780 [Deltaproteobacteria bacterium CG07_land_8_20_14_0_80_38_7]|nr:MAG: hypothetical protein COS89_07780 [Deltaproteobacteria bacterium CG07_land_8_20_14_0_80_38_7]
MSNSLVSDSFWKRVNQKLGEPRNDEERKEQQLVDSLHAKIKSDSQAVSLLMGLMANFHARYYRLRFFLDELGNNNTFNQQ